MPDEKTSTNLLQNRGVPTLPGRPDRSWCGIPGRSNSHNDGLFPRANLRFASTFAIFTSQTVAINVMPQPRFFLRYIFLSSWGYLQCSRFPQTESAARYLQATVLTVLSVLYLHSGIAMLCMIPHQSDTIESTRVQRVVGVTGASHLPLY